MPEAVISKNAVKFKGTALELARQLNNRHGKYWRWSMSAKKEQSVESMVILAVNIHGSQIVLPGASIAEIIDFQATEAAVGWAYMAFLNHDWQAIVQGYRLSNKTKAFM